MPEGVGRGARGGSGVVPEGVVVVARRAGSPRSGMEHAPLRWIAVWPALTGTRSTHPSITRSARLAAATCSSTAVLVIPAASASSALLA
jgi:hypothetical protein